MLLDINVLYKICVWKYSLEDNQTSDINITIHFWLLTNINKFLPELFKTRPSVR